MRTFERQRDDYFQLLAPTSHQLASPSSPLGGNHSSYLRQYNHQGLGASMIGGGGGFMPSAVQSAPVTPSNSGDHRLLFGPHSFGGVQLPPHHQSSHLFDTFVTSTPVTVQADRRGDYHDLLEAQQHQHPLHQLQQHDPVNSVISLLDTSGDDLASTSAMLSSARQDSQPNTPQNVGHAHVEQRVSRCIAYCYDCRHLFVSLNAADEMLLYLLLHKGKARVLL